MSERDGYSEKGDRQPDRHGYGCPYHYGPINYGRPGGDDKGEDCTCEVCEPTTPKPEPVAVSHV